MKIQVGTLSPPVTASKKTRAARWRVIGGRERWRRECGGADKVTEERGASVGVLRTVTSATAPSRLAVAREVAAGQKQTRDGAIGSCGWKRKRIRMLRILSNTIRTGSYFNVNVDRMFLNNK
jgi:hypothetical protein